MKRRVISLVMICCLVCSCLASPALAAEIEDESQILLDVLAYGTSEETGSTSVAMGGESSATLTFPLPSRTAISYIDVLFTWTSSTDIDVKLMNGTSTKSTLTVQHVAGNVYRAYGSFSTYYTGSIPLKFVAPSANSNRVTVESLKVGRFANNFVPIEAYCDILAAGSEFQDTIHYIPTDETNQRQFTANVDPNYCDIYIELYSEEWRSYDYLEYILFMNVDSVTNINAVFDATTVPCEVSFFGNDTSIGSSIYSVGIRIDVSQLDRTSEKDPKIIITGKAITASWNLIAVMKAVGSVEMESTNPLVFWSQYLGNMIQSSFDLQNGVISDQTTAFVEQADLIRNSIAAQTLTLRTAFTDAISGLSTTMVSKLNSIKDDLGAMTITLGGKIDTGFTNLKGWISDQTSALTSAISESTESIRSRLANVRDAIVDAVNGDSTVADDYKDDVTDQDEQLGEIEDAFESVETPDDFNAERPSDVTFTGQSNPTTWGFLDIFMSSTLRTVFVMSLTLAFVSYALYGKRG